MSRPKVSIVVPIYNTEKYLKRCLDSIVSQTLQEIEIILVDDGSKEVCSSLCDELALTDPRIRVVHKQNGGLGFARNTGIEEARGEYIGFVDSDDYIDPVMYETLYISAEKHQCDLAISGITFVGGNTFSQGNDVYPKSYFTNEVLFENEKKKDLLLGVIGALPHEPDDSRYGVSVCKNIFRLDLIREQNILFLSERSILSEDTIFMVDFIKHVKRAIGVPGAFYSYCRNGDSLSKSYKPDRFKKSIYFLDELEKRIVDTVTKEEYRVYLDRLIQGFGRLLCSQEIVHARDEKIKYSLLKNKLNEICSNTKIQGVLQTYPCHKLPLKQALFAFAMKYKLYYLQKVMVLLRDR